MKNVLFATTALVAMAGMASAEAGVSFSGGIDAGYNDAIEGGIFWDANLDMSASVDMGDNVTVSADVELFSWNRTMISGLGGSSIDYANNNLDIGTVTIEVAYTSDTLSASLKVGDLDDEGASEYFYADRDGMAVDVENHDATWDARALVEFGNFGVAAGCQVNPAPITNGGTCDQGINIGAGATFGSIELGVGYDDGNNGQTQVTAVSADAEFGAATVGVSYATSTAQDSIGVEVGYTVSDALSVGAYYASNSVANDEFGVSVDYTAGALTVGAYYDNDGTDSYGIDVGYAVTDMLTVNAGAFNDGTTVAYVGMDYAVNDNVTATVSWANADEISGPEYKDGITAMISASF